MKFSSVVYLKIIHVKVQFGPSLFQNLVTKTNNKTHRNLSQSKTILIKVGQNVYTDNVKAMIESGLWDIINQAFG